MKTNDNTLRLVIDPNGMVGDAEALKMVLQVLDREDSTVKFTKGLAVEIRTAKTQRSFKIITREAIDNADAGV